MNKKQIDYYMAGAFGLMVVCLVCTLWAYSRYKQAADALDAARNQIRIVKGVLVMSKPSYTQLVVDARLRTFLILAVLTGASALGMAAIVVWHRHQRLRLAAGTNEQVSKESVSG